MIQAPPQQAPTWDGQMMKSAGNILSVAFKAAKEKRKRWYDQGSEINNYGYSPKHDFQYQSLPSGAFFQAKEALTCESIRVMGPYLYQQNPHRTVQVKPWATEFFRDAAGILGDYLNTSITEYDSYANARRCVDQAIVWGRAIRWTGRHPKKPGIICSLYDDVRNFFDDPDADTPEERRIVFRLRYRPRDEVMAEYPDAVRQIKMIPKDQPGARADWHTNDCQSGADMVSYIEAYAIVGLETFKNGKQLGDQLEAMGVNDDAPRKYLFTESGLFITQTSWEVPFYIDGEWPFSELDFYDYPGSIYPVSPLEPGLNYQRAINWLSTFMMGRMRKAMRLVAAIGQKGGEGLSEENLDQLLIGSDVEYLLLQTSGGTNLKDFFQELNPSFEWLTAGMNMLNSLTDRYNKATGKYDILYYGQTGTQSRTATDAQMKDRNSRSRLEDMKDRIVKWETMTARKDALAARFLLSREEIGQVMGPKAAEQWGFLVDHDGQAKAQFAQQLQQNGFPPQQIEAIVKSKFEQAVTLKDWAAETDYSIEADSMRRRDIDAQLDSFKELVNQSVPTQMQSPNPQIQALAFFTVGEYLKLGGAAPELAKKYQEIADSLLATPPPPPPGAMPPGQEAPPQGAAPIPFPGAM